MQSSLSLNSIDSGTSLSEPWSTLMLWKAHDCSLHQELWYTPSGQVDSCWSLLLPFFFIYCYSNNLQLFQIPPNLQAVIYQVPYPWRPLLLFGIWHVILMRCHLLQSSVWYAKRDHTLWFHSYHWQRMLVIQWGQTPKFYCLHLLEFVVSFCHWEDHWPYLHISQRNSCRIECQKVQVRIDHPLHLEWQLRLWMSFLILSIRKRIMLSLHC